MKIIMTVIHLLWLGLRDDFETVYIMLTWYGLDGPEMESRFGATFSTRVPTGPGAHTASYSMDTGSFPGVKRPGRVADHLLHLAPRLKKE